MFVLAKEHALRLRHDQFGAEHILLGILDLPRGGAKTALDMRQVDRSQVRSKMEAIFPVGTAAEHRAELPYSATGMSVLRYAMAEAQSSGADAVSTGHLLLAALANEDDPTCRALELARISIPDLTAAAREHLDDSQSAG